MRRLLGLAWVGLLLAAMALAATTGAQVAWAHAARLSADPPDNAVLTTGPERVSATFNERLQTTFVAMTVVGPDGNLWSAGDPTVQGAVASIGMRALGPAGTYTVNYRVTSADGHVVSGSWSFRLAAAGTGTPGPAAAAGSADNRIAVWPFAVIAVALIGAGCLWAVRRRP
jgi:methionine-rich copper-binding protein CopC